MLHRVSDGPGHPVIFRLLSYFLFLALFIFILLTFRQRGISWDEPFQRKVGALDIAYYTSALGDLRAIDPEYPDRIYGGFFEMPAEAIVRFFPQHPYEARHLVNALAGLIGILGCWRLARRLGGELSGFVAVVMLMVFPSYIGHMFNNPKDIPFAAAYIWSVYCLVRTLSGVPKFSIGAFLCFGIAVGITAGIRVGGLILLPVAVIAWGGYWILAFGHKWARAWTGLLKTIGLMMLASAVAYSIMLLSWPWAQQHPIGNPQYALRLFSKWNGMAGDPMYLFRCLAVKLTEPILAGLFCALCVLLSRLPAVRDYVRSRQETDWGTFSAWLALAASFLLPATYIVAKRVVLYNEMRQVLFLSLPMVVCGSLAFAYWIGSCRKKSWARYMIVAILAALMALPASSIIRLYPYEYIYGNNLSGGLRRPGGEFTYEYYLHSYRELAFQLKQYLAPFDGRTCTVFVQGSPECFSYYMPAGLKLTDNANEADFAVYSIGNFEDKRRGRSVGGVSRCGVLLSTVVSYRSP